MSWRQWSRTGWLLALNGATLLLIVAALWLRLRPEPLPAAAAADGAGERTIALRRPSVADLAQAPLFSPSRQPQPEPGAQPAQAALAVGDAPTLIGVVGDNGAFRALLEDRVSADRQLVRRGASFAGWTVLAVDRKTAQLGAGGRRVLLDLSETRAGGGLAATAPNSGGTPARTPISTPNSAPNSMPSSTPSSTSSSTSNSPPSSAPAPLPNPPAGVVTGGGIPMPNTPIAPAPAASIKSTATQVRTQ